MAGKRDQASHEAAIARIAGALPHANVIRAQLGEVLNSAAFRGSRRSQEFLTHVVECALAGHWERLKERSLGMDVFGRDASYDTGGDSIVRVTASDVRKRLQQHYSECAQAPAFRIELPAGCYIPEFVRFNGFVPGAARGEPEGAEGNGAGAVKPLGRNSAAQGRYRKMAIVLLLIALGWVLGVTSAYLMLGASGKPAGGVTANRSGVSGAAATKGK